MLKHIADRTVANAERTLRGKAVWRLSFLLNAIRRLITAPVYSRECPLCGYNGIFVSFGWPIRPEARCPKCRSFERHRLLKLWHLQNASIFKGKRILHFSPESAVTEMISPDALDYKTADIDPGKANLVLNIEHLDLPASSVDVVICLHVLEHVNDRKALNEINRVLVVGGVAVLMAPVVEGWVDTYEDDRANSPTDRFLHFGQGDHIRYYGADIRSRIREAGFSLDEFVAAGAERVRFGLIPGERIFIAHKV